MMADSQWLQSTVESCGATSCNAIASPSHEQVDAPSASGHHALRLLGP
jgi:hypothetical protein